MLEFVYHVLATAHGIALVSSQLGSTAEYLGLATMILEHPEAEGVSVITFNYDTAIETAISSISGLLGKRWPAERLFFDYGFRQPVFSAVSPDQLNWASHLPNAYPAGRVPILKPHGSINVLRCSACAAVVYFPFQAFKDQGALRPRKTCPACSAGPLRPLIVPPGKRKTLPSALEQV